MICLADIANLRPHAIDQRDKALAAVISALHRVPDGAAIAAHYLAALRELAVLDKLELELITHGTARHSEAEHCSLAHPSLSYVP